MAIPPFPSQDLAKLVLGYLAEEQLMTAYDEFLQASPYLDVLRNEYDRIFMTSLRNILAEYRAVKIYVETCKPFALRKRLFQCTNMLEIVKFLVQNVDMSKVNTQDCADRISSEPRNKSGESKHTGCETCTSLKLMSCVCKSRQSSSVSNVQSSNMDLTLESSVETTALEDLPGNHVTTRKKHVKVLERDSAIVSQSSHEDNSDINVHSDGLSAVSVDQNLPSMQASVDSSVIPTNIPKPMDMESTPRPGEANEVRNVATNVTRSSYNSTVLNVCREKVSTATTFQDFATGVGGSENVKSSKSDSSTTEHRSHAPRIKDSGPKSPIQYPTCVKENTKAHILLKVGSIRPNDPNEVINLSEHNPGFRQIRPKPIDHKITILSDIKVDKTDKVSGTLNNATSTPLIQMQTITINGTPAYKRDSKCCYTADEIMAMPTLILVPKSGSTRTPHVSSENKFTTTQNTKNFSRKICCVPLPKNAVTQNTNPDAKDVNIVNNIINSNQSVNTQINPSTPLLEPLTIDVTDSPVSSKTTSQQPLQNPLKDANEPAMLVTTMDLKNASVPKDNVIEGCHKANTPQTLPPTRKSSSTPRRVSHVRVLDFTTPRRILQEPINENGQGAVDVIVSRSPNLHTFVEEASGDITTENSVTTVEAFNTNGSTKENNSTNKVCKSNWDADLRALAVADANNTNNITKHKPRTLKKKKLSLDKKTDTKKEDKKEVKKPSVNKKIAKSKKTKNLKCDEVLEDSIKHVEPTLPVKPNINIIPGSDWSIPETDKIQNKSNNDVQVETPEAERLSLQNAIEAKLNLSDFLATPYKQALYDIQMETPRFLGPDLPDDIPMSDIKIMNIPTPRFLNNTPKPQATPSSYSSRPTDYSSGGSYYKPDDQDYTVHDDLGYTLNENPPAAIVKEDQSEEKPKHKTNSKSRPVRKCAKNVSYYNSPSAHNKKEVDDKTDVASTCSATSVNSLGENKDKETVSKTPKETVSKTPKETVSKTPKETKPKSQTKSEPRKRNSTAKKRKTPIKKETPKTFIKIKPRRPTPTKESFTGKTKRKSESQTRKRTNSKEKHNDTPIVTCAPTKSRRKSSTPRKIHCTKQFNSESSGHESPDIKTKPTGKDVPSCAADSDTDQLALRWSDDGSQDGKPKETAPNVSANDTDDITKIREYIASSEVTKNINTESSLHDDLVKRGFDVETAKIIERDLLDTPPHHKEQSSTNANYEPTVTAEVKTVETVVEKVNESDCSTSTNLIIVQDEEEEELELTVHDCNEETENYITYQHDDSKETTAKPQIKLKDTFSMEVCIEDDVTVRLRATPFTTLLDIDPQVPERPDYDYRETEMAVSSISDIEKLYTPIKESIKATCYEIFDSTLTSLDTPLKVQSPKRSEATVTEIVLDVEKVEDKERDSKKRKRKRSSSSEDTANETKKTKPEEQYLRNPHLHNIDIETVLFKLHGP